MSYASKGFSYNKIAPAENTELKIPEAMSAAKLMKENKLNMLAQDGTVDVKDVNDFISTIAMLGASVDQNDPDSMREAFFAYLKLCKIGGHFVSNAAAYAAMGISQATASSIRTGRSRKDDSRYRDLIKFVDMISATNREVLLNEGFLNPIVGIWQQKNYDGMSDNPQGEKVVENPLGDLGNADEIRKRYGSSLIDD